ncbi:MAG: CvpA family protein [Thermodesulfobacteriota bacterium]
MISGVNLTGYDFVIIGLLCLFVGRGIWVGFLRQITVFIALYVGYLMAGQYHDRLLPFLQGVSENPQVVFWTAYVILFCVTYVVTMFIGKGLSHVVEMTIAVWFDKLLGALLGLAKAVIVVVLLHMILAGLLPPSSEMLQSCTLCPRLNQAEEGFKKLLKDEELRETFQQKQQAISEQVVRPFVPTPVEEIVEVDESGKLKQPEESTETVEQPTPQ